MKDFSTVSSPAAPALSAATSFGGLLAAKKQTCRPSFDNFQLGLYSYSKVCSTTTA